MAVQIGPGKRYEVRRSAGRTASCHVSCDTPEEAELERERLARASTMLLEQTKNPILKKHVGILEWVVAEVAE